MDILHQAIGKLLEWVGSSARHHGEIEEMVSEAEERPATEDIQDPRNTSLFFLLPPV